MSAEPKPCAIVVGVGHPSGIGAAMCRRCVAEGLPVYVAGRNQAKLSLTVAQLRAQGGQAMAVVLDATQADEVQALFDRVRADGCQAELVLHNVGNNAPARFMKTSPAFFEQLWRLCFLSSLNVGQATVRHMLPAGQGTLLFTGASASLRGRPLFAAFAAGKAALRALAFGMAGEFGPQGLHVAHVIVDGVVDGDKVAGFAGGLGAAYLCSKGREGTLDPNDIAKTFWQIHRQPRGLWTREIDLRPFKEKF
ncbi:MAG: SDR family NAD(P)-dependent oxidoreductase [Rubrivivax sp.]|nr:MAG: SDR family NAD(P)-dependent oxidoreductase [Rubrivivax sp.]